MDHTQKIQNEHADEQIEVSGSQIESNSQNNNEFDEPKQNLSREKISGGYAETKNVNIQGGYDASQYANLPVSGQIKQLFKSIQRYNPILADIDTKLKAFVPDYIPAVGEVDAFLKMPRPDGQPQILGLNVLDQPCLNQSDKAKCQLMIANSNKQYRGGKYSKVHAIQSAQKNPKQIVSWINSVADVHKNKQPPSVSYSKSMPDIDSLMQVWPAQVQQVLSQINFPNEEIDLSLEDYCKIACNLLDIPVYGDGNNSLVQSLHVMFTLYSAFKQNQHFNMNQDNQSYLQQH